MLLLLLSLRLFDRPPHLGPMRLRSFSGPFLIAAGAASVDRLRRKADPAVIGHGSGAAVANGRINHDCVLEPAQPNGSFHKTLWGTVKIQSGHCCFQTG